MDSKRTGKSTAVNRSQASTVSPLSAERLGQIIDRHADALRLYARQICDSADDVVQESLVELASQATPPDDPVAWLYCVVRNRAISARRAERRRRRRETTVAQRQRPWFDEGAEATLDAETATRALADMPQRYREVVVAHLWGGLTFVQIGALLGISSSSAHRRYVAALERLRESLGLVQS
jgi:RNA polymerase sigma-70 factor (ECF subfamily)